MPAPFRGVLFDFDGTLVRSMEDNFTAWQRVLGPFGIEIERDEYFPIEGTSVRRLAEIFLSKKPRVDITPDELVQKKDAIYREIHKFSLYPGVTDVLTLLVSIP